MHKIICDVKEVSQLQDFIYRIILAPQTDMSFIAGQYLEVIMGERDHRPFSIASSPEKPFIELHIGASEASSYPMEVVKKCQETKQLEINAPLGSAHLQDSERPLILIAGGTGFSFVKSIADHLAATKDSRPVKLFWGGRTIDSLYASEELEHWANSADNFEYHPVVEQQPIDWKGYQGYVHQAVLEHVNNINQYDIYIAGPFEMARVVRDDFIAAGAQKEHLFADAYAFI